MEKIIDKYKSRIYSLAFRLSKDHTDDLVEAGIIAISRNYNKYDPTKGNEYNFFYNKIKKAMLDELRKNNWFKRNQGDKEMIVTPNIGDYVNDECDIEEVILTREVQEIVRSNIEKLSPFHQSILRLIYWNGMTMLEVSSYLGISEASVSDAHKEAIAQLKEIINDRDL